MTSCDVRAVHILTEHDGKMDDEEDEVCEIALSLEN